MRLRAWAVLLAVVAAGCDSPTGDGAITTVVVEPAADTLAPGDTLYLIARVRDGAGNPVDDVDVSWSTDATAIDLRAVSAADTIAEVVAVEPGRVRLTAEADGMSSGVDLVILQRTYHDPSGSSYYDIAGTGPDDVWVAVVGAPGIFRYDGTAWDTLDWPGADMRGIWVPSAGEAWAVGERWTGTAYMQLIVHVVDGAVTETEAPTATRLSAIWGSGPSDIWAVGDSGVILHYDGGGWADVTPEYGADRPSEMFRTPWGTGPGDIWFPGISETLHYDGVEWTRYSAIDAFAVHGTGSSNVWAVGNGAAYHFDGTSWSTVEMSWPGAMAGLWVVGPEDIWAGSRRPSFTGFTGTVVHYNGTSAWKNDPLSPEAWRPVGPSGQFWDVWASGGADIWMITEDRILQLHPPD